MKFEELRHNRDFLGGLFYIVVGVVAIWIARDYPFGSALRMGPGYFPTTLSAIMILFGVAILAMGLRKPEALKGSNWSIRALIVLPIATAVFGWMMEEAGFLPAMLVLIPLSAAAGKDFKFSEIAMLTVGLTILCTLMFIEGLGLPYPLIKGLWGY